MTRVSKMLTSFLGRENISLELIGEVLGGFIVERCDNMLANTLLTSRLRITIHELARTAYMLYRVYRV